MTLKHIVTWKIATEDSVEKAAQAVQISVALHSLVAVIPEILSLKVANDVVGAPGSHDVILVSEFADAEALQRYIDHPEHQKVATFIRTLIDGRASVDYLD